MKDIKRAAKKIDTLAKSINRYCYMLENPCRSTRLLNMKDQFDDMKAEYIEQGIWETVCELTGMVESATGADCAA